MDDDEQTKPGSAELVLSSLSKAIAEISAFSECRDPFRNSYYDLGRRIKLLSPLVDEFTDGVPVEEAEVGALASLLDVLVSAKDLLRSVNVGSKLYQEPKGVHFNLFMVNRGKAPCIFSIVGKCIIRRWQPLGEKSLPKSKLSARNLFSRDILCQLSEFSHEI